MQFSRWQTRWSIALVGLFALSALLSLVSYHGVTADEKAAVKVEADHDEAEAAAADENAAGVEDLTENVTVQISDVLRIAGQNLYSVEATIANTSGEDLAGPLLLVIEDTAVEGLDAKNADGTLESREAYFEFVPADDSLAKGKTTDTKKLVFESQQRLSLDERRQFELSFRVTRQVVTPAADEADGPAKAKKEAPAAVVEGDDAQAEALKQAIKLQDEFTKQVIDRKEVVGTATGFDADGNPVIKVFGTRSDIDGIPKNFGGVPVEIVATGPILARQQSPDDPDDPNKGSQTVSPRSRFERPVPIGVSSGNVRQCSTGTIGCRVRGASGSAVYILSNNHVIALQNNAAAGDRILQPGRVDTQCRTSDDNVIAELSQFVEIRFTGNNEVDAAIALVRNDSVGIATPANGYGAPKSQTNSAFPGQRVQKYGRTSALTKGTVVGINATINVGYSAGNARFVRQIVVYGDAAGFIKAGDSGSLLVNDPGRNPVGLLFAGSLGGQYGIANPISAVLAAFDVTIDGEEANSNGNTSETQVSLPPPKPTQSPRRRPQGVPRR